MIKALLLIFEPAAAWEKIALARRTVGYIVATYLLPLLIITSVIEGIGLAKWGRSRGRVSEVMHMQTFPKSEVVVFEVFQVLLLLGVVFVGAKMVKSIGETFHGRHTYTQAFTAVAYGLSPLFLFRVLDAFPRVNPWISFAIGMVLSIGIMYQGIPRIMAPDPPHALGLFFMSSLLLAFVAGLVRFVTYWYLMGYSEPLRDFVSKIAGFLPLK